MSEKTAATKVIKCSYCDEPAVTIIRYAKLRLCKKHFTEFIVRKVRRSIERYRLIESGWRVLVAVSGGKDSNSLLHILAKLSKEMNFEIIALHIDLGIGEYSKKSREAVEKLCKSLGVPLIIVDLRELIGAGLPDIVARTRRPACSVCGLIKRYIINVVGVELGADVVALGHHLDDLLPYIFKNFILQNLGEISKLGPRTESDEGLVGRIRPLYEVLESEIMLYTTLESIPVVNETCPLSIKRRSLESEVRDFLERLESRSPGFKIGFARSIARNIDFYRRGLANSKPLRRCAYCGMPTSEDVCAFCKLTERTLGKPMGPIVREKVRETIARLGLVRKSEASN